MRYTEVFSFEETLSEIEFELAAEPCSHAVVEMPVVGREKIVASVHPNQLTSTAS
jgi:hypothetical protein